VSTLTPSEQGNVKVRLNIIFYNEKCLIPKIPTIPKKREGTSNDFDRALIPCELLLMISQCKQPIPAFGKE
jgi:hypothetical protein